MQSCAGRDEDLSDFCVAIFTSAAATLIGMIRCREAALTGEDGAPLRGLSELTT